MKMAMEDELGKWNLVDGVIRGILEERRVMLSIFPNRVQKDEITTEVMEKCVENFSVSDFIELAGIIGQPEIRHFIKQQIDDGLTSVKAEHALRSLYINDDVRTISEHLKTGSLATRSTPYGIKPIPGGFRYIPPESEINDLAKKNSLDRETIEKNIEKIGLFYTPYYIAKHEELAYNTVIKYAKEIEKNLNTPILIKLGSYRRENSFVFWFYFKRYASIRSTAEKNWVRFLTKNLGRDKGAVSRDIKKMRALKKIPFSRIYWRDLLAELKPSGENWRVIKEYYGNLSKLDVCYNRLSKMMNKQWRRKELFEASASKEDREKLKREVVRNKYYISRDNRRFKNLIRSIKERRRLILEEK